MQCAGIVCMNVTICVLNCIVIVSKDPMGKQISCITEDEEFDLPCPMVQEIIDCNLIQIKNQCWCGTCPITETKSPLTESTTVPGTKVTTAIHPVNKTITTTTKNAESLFHSDDRIHDSHPSNDKKTNSVYLLMILIPILAVVTVVVVVGFLKRQQFKSWIRSMRRRRRQRQRVFQREQNLGLEELRVITGSSEDSW